MKYILLKHDHRIINNQTLYRIQALKDFSNIKKGDLGGYIESESNLSQHDTCWVYKNAHVLGDAWVSGNARVSGTASVYGTARIVCGELSIDMFDDMKNLILCSLNAASVNGEYTLYKRVNKVSKSKYASCYDKSFIYITSKYKTVKDADLNKGISCAKGMHVSTPMYWLQGDTLIAVKVKLKDVITCLSGKLRVKKLYVIGECD